MITLTSDFGSPYPAAMKGVMLRRTDAQLVDIAHDLPRQDPRAAAFWLRETVPYFPPAVHLAVVDPGVGTDRRAITIRVGDHALVGPDNGLLRPVVRRLRESASENELTTAAYEIVVDDPDSATFHGRDVFAPAAAEIHAAGVTNIETVDTLRSLPLSDCVDLSLPTATRDGDAIHGEVLVVDDFGNAITNVPGEWLDGIEAAVIDGDRVPVGKTFAAVELGERLLTTGSHGYVECDVNQGRGDDAFGLKAGASVTIRPAATD
jgi:S-adenosylmethionine hydrolase